MKGQDTAAALGALRAAAPHRTPVVCMQNGVDNERRALRLFQNVYGAVVMLPAAHIEPGVVESHASRLTGIVDVGRYPSGADDAAEEIATALRASRFDSCARDDVMRLKYAKLIAQPGQRRRRDLQARTGQRAGDRGGARRGEGGADRGGHLVRRAGGRPT